MKPVMEIEKEVPVIFYKKNIKYEITINPNDKNQYFGNPRRLQLFIMHMQKLLQLAFDNYGIRYKLHLELSEPKAINKESHKMKSTSGARLHFHGTLAFPSDAIVGEFLLKSQYLLSRHSDIQLNSYREEYWPKYILKQRKVIEALAIHYKTPVVLTHHQPEIKR